MSLQSPSPIDTRHFFRPVSSSLLAVLRQLKPDAWERPTLAGTWTVRDVLAHLVDVTFRRVSFQRDRMAPPPPPFPIEGERDFVRFINALNHEWVSATRRCSPHVLTEMFELASRDLADFVESRPIETLNLFGVSWAGEMTSDGWFDVGREFTELWHHQMQIRLAVEAPALDDSRYLKAVIDISARVFPHACRDLQAQDGAALLVEVPGAAGGTWTVRRDQGRWVLWAGRPDQAPTARLTMTDDTAWRLLYNALPSDERTRAITIEGDATLAEPIVRARSIVI